MKVLQEFNTKSQRPGCSPTYSRYGGLLFLLSLCSAIQGRVVLQPMSGDVDHQFPALVAIDCFSYENCADHLPYLPGQLCSYHPYIFLPIEHITTTPAQVCSPILGLFCLPGRSGQMYADAMQGCAVSLSASGFLLFLPWQQHRYAYHGVLLYNVSIDPHLVSAAVIFVHTEMQ